MDFREKEIESVKNHITKFYSFISENITKSREVISNFKDIKSKYSKVMLSKVIGKFIEAKDALEIYNIRKYLQISFYEIFNLIQEFNRDSDDMNDFLIVFKMVYEDWLKILSITIPHLCEELWEASGNEGFISKVVWGDFNNQYNDKNIENDFEYISNIIEDIFNIKKIMTSEKLNNVYLYTAPEWKYRIIELILLKKDKFNEIMSVLKNKKELLTQKALIPFIKSQIKERIWEKNILQINETKLIEDYRFYIEKRVNSKIILNSDFDPKNRAERAKPFKPALYIDI
jgi:leucyl-tRNA synthetase